MPSTVHRRAVLRVAGGLPTAVAIGSLGPLGLSLTDIFAMPAQAAESTVDGSALDSGRRLRSCVVVWLDGGPSHLETLDPKPAAPSEVRGPLAAIASAVPGILLSESLPRIAAQMADFCIIRSMTSPLGEHNFGAHYMLSGYRPTPVLEYPSFSSLAASLRTVGTDSHAGPSGRTTSNAGLVLPPHVAIPNYRVGGGGFHGHGFLTRRVAPFATGGDPASSDFAVQNLTAWSGLTMQRLDRRREFVRQLADFRKAVDGDVPHTVSTHSSLSPPTPASDLESPGMRQAWDLVTSPTARDAFRLEDEPPQVRDRYGRRTVGQSCLLARRLIERGVPFVTVNHTGWDTHADLFTRLQEGFTGAKTPVGLAPSLDQAVTALVAELRERGLLDDTLIVVMGEFGRTPKINATGGRDHWPRVFSVALAGGGVRGGQIVGASDQTGESPADLPITPGDLVHTIATLLGIDPHHVVTTPDGRPVTFAPGDSQLIRSVLR